MTDGAQHAALHASAPKGLCCADCTMDGEPCATCYSAWWKARHPEHVGYDNEAAMEVLNDLCVLKRRKDIHGKDALYEVAQPIAWRRAFEIVERWRGNKLS